MGTNTDSLKLNVVDGHMIHKHKQKITFIYTQWQCHGGDWGGISHNFGAWHPKSVMAGAAPVYTTTDDKQIVYMISAVETILSTLTVQQSMNLRI